MRGTIVPIKPNDGHVVDAATGWPVTASAHSSLGVDFVEVALTDPRSDETVFVVDLTVEGARRLASQLLELVRDIPAERTRNRST